MYASMHTYEVCAARDATVLTVQVLQLQVRPFAVLEVQFTEGHANCMLPRKLTKFVQEVQCNLTVWVTLHAVAAGQLTCTTCHCCNTTPSSQQAPGRGSTPPGLYGDGCAAPRRAGIDSRPQQPEPLRSRRCCSDAAGTLVQLPVQPVQAVQLEGLRAVLLLQLAMVVWRRLMVVSTILLVVWRIGG